MDDVSTAQTLGTMPILIAPDPALKLHAKPVGPGDTDLVRDLSERMLATMYRAPGIGLAAPQVGVALRLAVIDLQTNKQRTPITLINPEVVAISKERAAREEGCLSLPNQYAEVTRPAVAKVRYQDLTGAWQEIEVQGLLGACMQHEIDHLDGVLFIDHVSALRRNMILRRLVKQQRLMRDGR